MEEISRLKASRKAHRAHLTRIFGKIDEILQSDAIPNEKQTATLRTSLEQIEAKKATVEELDSRIIERIQDPDGLESEILDAEEIQYNAAEKITLIKAVLARQRPLNIQAAPFQPPSSEDDRPPSPVANALQHGETRNNDRAIHVEPPTQEQRYANTSIGISQNVSRLPKLTLPIFEGDPLLWQTFWDSFEPVLITANLWTF